MNEKYVVLVKYLVIVSSRSVFELLVDRAFARQSQMLSQRFNMQIIDESRLHADLTEIPVLVLCSLFIAVSCVFSYLTQYIF